MEGGEEAVGREKKRCNGCWLGVGVFLLCFLFLGCGYYKQT